MRFPPTFSLAVLIKALLLVCATLPCSAEKVAGQGADREEFAPRLTNEEIDSLMGSRPAGSAGGRP